MTYTMTTEIQTAAGTTTETIPGLLEGDVESMRQAAKVTAGLGDTVLITVTEDPYL
jgi:hypothetical protein